MADEKPPEQKKELEQYEDQHSEPMDVQKIHSPIYREFNEPRDGYQPIPTWWLMVMIIILMWGGWYIGEYNAGFSSRVYDSFDPEASMATATDGQQEEQEVDLMALGKRVYNNCQSCHKSDGQGVTGQYPPLTDSKWVLGRPEVFARIILHGLQGPIEVQGVMYNNVMPGWSRLTDQQIAAVMTYERNSFGNSASEVSPDLVATVRQTTAGRTQPYTADELYQALENLPPETTETETAGEAQSATETVESGTPEVQAATESVSSSTENQ